MMCNDSTPRPPHPPRRRSPRSHRRLVRAGALLALVVAAITAGLLVAAPAQAHAVLVGSDPGDGAVLDAAPAEVVVRFNEPVEPPAEPLRVFDADGQRVDAGDAGSGADRSMVRVSLPADLPDGVYVVAWRVISADTHPVRGSFVFTVGDPAGADAGAVAVPDDGADTGWQIAAGLARWLTYAGTLLAAGGAVFLVLVATGAGERPRLARVVGAAVAAALAGTVVGLPLQAVITSGTGAGALVDEALLADLVASPFGASTLVRLAGLTVLFVGVAGLGVLRWAAPTALGGAAAALGSFVLAGHTVTSEPRLLVGVSNFAHTAAAAVWFGGLVLLALLLRQRHRAGAEAESGAQVVTRFSTLAVGSVLVVAAAGTVLGWAEVRSWQALFSTGYGWVLLAKAALVGAVVTIGGYNNRALVPAIRRGGARAWQRLHRTVRVEAAVILVGVLAVTTVLVVLPPARHQGHAAAQASAAEPYAGHHPLGPDHHVHLMVDPAAAGTNEVTVHLRDAAGEPADIGQQVELRFSLPEADINRITREAEPAEPGTWVHRGPELSITGTWQVEVRVLVDDFQRLTATADVPVGAAGSAEHEHEHHHP